MPADFDAFQDTYLESVDRAVGFSGQAATFFIRRKAELLLDLARRGLGDPAHLSVLDVGCGVGETDQLLESEVESLVGVDVSADSIERAAARNPRGQYVAVAEGGPLPFDDGKFDLTFAICVLHHVPTADHMRFLAEMRRVTAHGGLVAIFEHNPWNPLTRKAIRDCPFDEGVTLVSRPSLKAQLQGTGLTIAEARYIIFSPWALPALEWTEQRLAWLPLGAQHFVAGRRS